MVKSLFLKLLSIPYSIVILIRNKLFDFGVLSQKRFDLPIISVGNLSAGGTGKTPMIECLLEEFSSLKNVAVLSRGYKRKTSGFKLVELDNNVDEVGDEPMQIKNNFPNVTVAVCEERVVGIENLLKQHKDLNLILLDDAYQHRYVKPSYSILLTDKNKLFTNDSLLPHGMLREPRANAKRADMVIVTKCENNMEEKEKEQIRIDIKNYTSANVFFSSLQYAELKLVSKTNDVELKNDFEILCVTGIANAMYLVQYLKSRFGKVSHVNYRDHYDFSKK
ncbi:MAG: tetraacyldisaccharide 4'-kinase, partial [Bacteroidia bacterium]|nr:tetraacyldisaccharide 4'-kinase [Bacteroidia bacterium]